jgi:hypothetical protein
MGTFYSVRKEGSWMQTGIYSECSFRRYGKYKATLAAKG